jgi:hypothetical protein
MSEVLKPNPNEMAEEAHRKFLRREVAAVLYEQLRKKRATTAENAASQADSIVAFERMSEFYDRLLSNEKVRFTAFEFKVEDEVIVRKAFLAEGIKHFEKLCLSQKLKGWRTPI